MKKILKVIAIILYINSFSNLSALARTILVSVPKAGTHLAIECIRLLEESQFKFTGDITIPQYVDICLKNLSSNTFLVSHIPYSWDFSHAISKHQAKMIFLYRDPRDQLVSYAHYIRKNDCSNAPHQAWPMAQHMSFDQIIDSLITEKKLYRFFPGIAGVGEFYNAFMPWIHFKNCLAIRFEDLIGPKGGGSQEIQYATIKSIAHYLNMTHVTDEKIKYVMDNLFGIGSAFRLGQIGSWKTTFNTQQIIQFKKIAGSLLIDLQYENDENW